MPDAAGRVVVVGDVMTDVVATLSGPIAHGSDVAARIVERGGGAAANLAVWLARTGTPVALVGRVGDDAAGRLVADELRSEGVDAWLQVDARRPTGRCIVLVEPGGERTMLPDAGANAGLEEALPDGARHLHVAGYALLHPGARPAALGTVSRARATGVPFSLDPSSAAPLARVGADRFLDWVEGAALLLPNRAEAAVLAGIEDAEAAARALCSRGIGEVVVKLGGEGALWTDGHAVLRASARPVVAEADTTGAGDAFAAGLLAARLAGAGPDEALEAGCELAARAVGRAGAR